MTGRMEFWNTASVRRVRRFEAWTAFLEVCVFVFVQKHVQFILLRFSHPQNFVSDKTLVSDSESCKETRNQNISNSTPGGVTMCNGVAMCSLVSSASSTHQVWGMEDPSIPLGRQSNFSVGHRATLQPQEESQVLKLCSGSSGEVESSPPPRRKVRFLVG